MALAIGTRPSLTLSQSLPSGSFLKSLIILHQRTDRLKTTTTENSPIWSHGPQSCLTQWNNEPCYVGSQNTDGPRWRVQTKCSPLESHLVSSVAQLRPTLCDPKDWSMSGVPVTTSRSLLKFLSIESVMPSNHLILCRPLLFPPSIVSSNSVFANESILHIRWPKCWSFSFRISPPNEYSGLIFFSMDLLNLPVVQETLMSFLQHHSSKASILWHSAFFTVQLSHPYMTTGKTIVLTRQNLSTK